MAYFCEMENLSQGQIFPDGELKKVAAPDAEEFVDLLPALHYGTNKLLEDSTGAKFSRKVGIALWVLARSTERDTIGEYLTTSDLVRTFREWLVVNEEGKKGAASVVSKVKGDLFDLGYIIIAGGSDHIHLTEKGKAAAGEMMERANTAVQRAVSILTPDEQRALLGFANRMVGSMRKKNPTSQSF
jgi:hypothetical protein